MGYRSTLLISVSACDANGDEDIPQQQPGFQDQRRPGHVVRQSSSGGYLSSYCRILRSSVLRLIPSLRAA